MNRDLYSWQEDCLKRWQAAGGRGMVQAVTGSGKTRMALTAAARLEELAGEKLKVRIVVPTGALMRQWAQALREFPRDSLGGEERRRDIGMRGSGHTAPADRKYLIYVVNSARYELARQILAELRQGDTVFLIADECHHYVSGQNQLIFEFLPHIGEYEERFFSMGLSATLPGGEARQYLASVLGPGIYTYGMEKAMAMATVCRYEIYHIGLSFEKGERVEYDELSERMIRLYNCLCQSYPSLRTMSQGECFELLKSLCGDKNRRIAETAKQYLSLSYKRKSLVCLASARISCACDLVQRLDEREKILLFGERISQAEEIYRLLAGRYPGRVGRCHSGMGQQANRNVLERFRDGELRILIACKSIDEGVDVPDAAVGIVLSGTAARRQRIQRLGRIIRQRKGKSASLYYLHIVETSEDDCYLPGGSGHAIFELEYLPGAGRFLNPAYDEAAKALLRDMGDSGASGEKIREAMRCLRLGCVRSDWLRDTADLEERKNGEKYVSDRNYWSCMKRLKMYKRED
ncbi:MAG: DEAD/DEAH box helicase [Hungatella sp.]|nr:DEAD/DEAH box helicase [Hungatella sp.]